MMKRVDARQAKQLLQKPHAILVDIRDPVSYRDFHLDNSHHLCIRNLSMFMHERAALKNAPIVFVSHTDDDLGFETYERYLFERGFTGMVAVGDIAKMR